MGSDAPLLPRRRSRAADLVLLGVVLVFGAGVHLGLHVVEPPHQRHTFVRDAPPPPPPPPPPALRAGLYASLVEREQRLVEEVRGVEAAAAAELDVLEAAAASEVRALGAAAGAARDAVAEELGALAGAAPAGAGPMEDWAWAGRTFPVVVLACDREALLRRALSSLVGGAGANGDDVLVAQDGDAAAVARVVAEFAGVRLARNFRGAKKLDGAARIARHYKFALGTALATFADAPAVIVAEDDLVVSPDFLRYFAAVGPAAERDATIFVVSAWNDNGFAPAGVADARALRRSAWFPGLGWLLPRALWDAELRDAWPRTHWDHWMREARVRRGRECVFPEVPRTFHAGREGTFMDAWHDARYFAPIAAQRDAAFDWPRRAAYAPALADAYERRVAAALRDGDHANSLAALRDAADGASDRPLVLWYAWPAKPDVWSDPPPFVCLSEVLRIWHEPQRAAHRGLHEHYLGARKVILVNAKESPYRTLKPPGLAPLTRKGCPATTWADLGKK